MGSCKNIIRSRGGYKFRVYQYTSTESIGDIKVIEKKDEFKTGRSEDPPIHSGRSNAYWGVDIETKRVMALRIYKNRNSFMEFHMHETPGNPEGTVHFHLFTRAKNGKFVRLKKEYRLTVVLQRKYGPLLKEAYRRNLKKGYGGYKPNFNFYEEGDSRRTKRQERMAKGERK